MSGKSLSGFDPAALARLDKRFGAMSDNSKAKGFVAQALSQQADILVGEMRAAIHEKPGGTGHLKQSIRKEIAGNGTQVFVKAGGPLTTKPVKHGHTATFDYALAEEFGTEREGARPFFYNTFRAAIPRIIAAATFSMTKTLPPAIARVAQRESPGTSYFAGSGET